MRDGKVVALVTARDFSLLDRQLRGVTITAYDRSGLPAYVLLAPELQYTNEEEWRMTGGGTLLPADGRTYVRIKGDVWPTEVERADFSPEDIERANLKDLDALSMRRMLEQIQTARSDPRVSQKQLANLEYGYYNKLALPLAAFIYALVGAPLGIRSHRAGTATGFWLSVIIIFGYMMLANLMAIYAQGRAIPAWAASFTPLAVGLFVALFAIHRKNI
jgi:lipopolysaccharide export system permease protein